MEEIVAGHPVPVLSSDAWLVFDDKGRFLKKFKTRAEADFYVSTADLSQVTNNPPHTA
jgi:hypothetical protein